MYSDLTNIYLLSVSFEYYTEMLIEIVIKLFSFNKVLKTKFQMC
jgi:hypothetical protein